MTDKPYEMNRGLRRRIAKEKLSDTLLHELKEFFSHGAVDTFSVAVVMTALDKTDMTSEQVIKFVADITELFHSCMVGAVSIEDCRQTILEETGLTL